MTGEMILAIAVFGMVASLVLLAAILASLRKQRIEKRLADISSGGDRNAPLRSVSSVLPALGSLLMPQKKANRDRIQERLVHAGLYRRPAAALFFGMKFVLMVLPMAVGLGLWSVGLLAFDDGLMYGAIVGLIGTLAPSAWIGARKSARQKHIRRALPDALDVIVICLEGGLSLPASFARVTEELHAAYPLLATEMVIVRKEIELGKSTGAAFQDLAARFDIDELRSMAALITQAERFGASLVRTLRVQADDLRLKRYQYAEAQAQKAPLKLIFPTVLCIFPALYIVLMGPAGVQFLQMIQQLRK
jgi:tight adherence protein C